MKTKQLLKPPSNPFWDTHATQHITFDNMINCVLLQYIYTFVDPKRTQQDTYTFMFAQAIQQPNQKVHNNKKGTVSTAGKEGASRRYSTDQAIKSQRQLPCQKQNRGWSCINNWQSRFLHKAAVQTNTILSLVYLHILQASIRFIWPPKNMFSLKSKIKF